MRPAPTGPLPEVVRAAFAEVHADPKPKHTTLDRHYVVSNEARPALFRDAIANRGGVQVGVGTEQNLLFAGWSKPELLVLMDFDQWVVDVNWLHGLLIGRASTPDEYIELWSRAHAKEVEQWVKERWPDVASERLEPFRLSRETVYQRLSLLRRLLRSDPAGSYLTDAAQFAWLKRLWEEGRWIPVRGDLTGATTIKELSAVAKRFELPIRVFYMSNAQDYFTWSKGDFRDNVLALPFDERSLVVQTLPSSGRLYNYVTQPGLAYQRWLRSRAVDQIGDLFRYAKRLPGKEPLYTIEAEPPAR